MTCTGDARRGRARRGGSQRHRRSATAPRTVLAAALVTLVVVPMAGCVDFVEPEIPNADTPATLQVAITIVDGQTAQVSGLLRAGFDHIGIRRPLDSQPLTALGREIQPREAASDTLLAYQDTLALAPGAALGPIVVEPPTVPGTVAPGPMSWAGIQRVGPDSLILADGADLALELEVSEGGTAAIRQWFIVLAGTASFRISADGPPPERITIPAHWLPAPRADGTVAVTLTDIQSETRVGPTGDYVVSGTVHSRVTWTVRTEPPDDD
jgi:hypothetical protein